MKCLIIGLGIYGENLARDLVAMGHEVIGVDTNHVAVETLKNYVSAVYLIDSTEENQLNVLPLNNIDLAIVAIGENFGASIKTVALLKKMGVKHIYARAIDTLHESILQSFEIDRILTPEQNAANNLAHELELGSEVVTMSVGNDYLTANFRTPQYLYELSYEEIRKRLLENFKIHLIAVCRPVVKENVLGISHPVQTVLEDYSQMARMGDQLTIFGSRKKIIAFCHKVS